MVCFKKKNILNGQSLNLSAVFLQYWSHYLPHTQISVAESLPKRQGGNELTMALIFRNFKHLFHDYLKLNLSIYITNLSIKIEVSSS